MLYTLKPSHRQYLIFSATHYCNLRREADTETGKNVEVWRCMTWTWHTCYQLTQGIGLRFWPNLFPIEYNSRPGELDTWCWCLNKVKVILKIVQFGFRNLWSSSGWHDWSTKHRSRFVTMLIYLRSYSTFCWEFNCSHTAPSQTRFCQLTNPSAPRHFQGLKG